MGQQTIEVPPQNLEAEVAVLGSILRDNAVAAILSGDVSAEDFYRESHRKIFRALSELISKDLPADIITLSDYLASRGELESVGGSAYLASIEDATPTSANARYYAGIVREKSAMRQIIVAARDLQNQIAENGKSVSETTSKFSFALSEILAKYSDERKSFIKFEDFVLATLKQLEGGRNVEQIKTGFYDLDNKTGGLAIGDLWIVAGRPSMGKSSLAVSMAVNMAREFPVALVSAETTKEQVMRRVISAMSGVDNFRLKSGILRDEDYPRIAAIESRVGDLKIHVFDSDRSWDKIKTEVELLKRREPGLKVLIIDYIGLLSAPVPRGERWLEVGRISSEAKTLGPKLGVAVIVLSQLNRNVEERPDRRPKLADLRESGNLEQDADVVLMLYRKAYYDKDAAGDADQEVEVGIMKNRDGPTGNISLLFRPRTVSFLNMEGQR